MITEPPSPCVSPLWSPQLPVQPREQQDYSFLQLSSTAPLGTLLWLHVPEWM